MLSRLEAAAGTRELREGELIVGSGAQASWRIEKQDLMPRHFIVSLNAGAAFVRPFCTDDVISVNGVQSGPQPLALNSGDTIDAGSARFVYLTGDSSAAGATLSPPAPATAFLLEERSDLAHSLSRTVTGIGRDPSNEILLHDPSASRFHAQLRREAGGYALHPRGSSGTAVNGRAVTSPLLLRDGDRIEIAFEALRFIVGPLPEEAHLPDPTATTAAIGSVRVTSERRRTSLDQLTPAEPPRRWAGWAILAVLLGLLGALALLYRRS